MSEQSLARHSYKISNEVSKVKKTSLRKRTLNISIRLVFSVGDFPKSHKSVLRSRTKVQYHPIPLKQIHSAILYPTLRDLYLTFVPFFIILGSQYQVIKINREIFFRAGFGSRLPSARYSTLSIWVTYCSKWRKANPTETRICI